MSLGWFLFIMVAVLYLQSRIYTKWGFKGLTYERSFNTNAVFEGEEALMVERIRNKKLLILPWLRIESKIDPSLKFSQTADLSIKHDEFHNSIFSLMPYGLSVTLFIWQVLGNINQEIHLTGLVGRRLLD